MTSVRPHVIILSPTGRAAQPNVAAAEIAPQLARQTQVGSTQHFVVYSDGTADGDASAQAVLARCEDDYATVSDWFGGLPLPQGQEGDDQATVRTALPLHVLMDAQAGGAYHFGCDATNLYIEPDPTLADGLMVAELVEVFEAAQNAGWDCGHVNGEALSRVLATARQPELGALTQQTGQGWWASGHADYVTSNAADDQNQDANGCGPLFLYYLHSQLGFSWQQIIAAAGPTLGAGYQTLTGNSPASGFADFINLLVTLDQGGQIALPASGNPFPIGSAATSGSPPSTSSGQATPAPSAPPSPASPLPAVPAGAATPVAPSAGGNGSGGAVGWMVAVAVVIVVLIVLALTGVIRFG